VAFLGVGMVSTEPVWLGIVAIIASSYFLVTARSEWRTPAQSEVLAEEAHQLKVASWQDARVKSTDHVVAVWEFALHLKLAEQLGVPERLRTDFANLSYQNDHLRKSDWQNDIDTWVGQPTFPPPPSAVPSGLSHSEYEEYCRQVLVSWGYLDAQTTRFSRDGGIDVESEVLVVQCKHYSGSVGVREVREIFGIAAHKSKIAVVFSAGSFTSDAKAFAAEAGVALFELHEEQGKVRSVNSRARAVEAENSKMP
jgi:hypothetical protein